MTRQEDGSVLYAVYGTLRRGHGNWRYRLDGRSEYLGEMKTEPVYTMVGKNRGFPYVAEGGNTPITVEIFRVTDQATINGVNALEGYSGIRGDERNWYDTCEIQTEWGTANMFINNEYSNPDPKTIIETGDWNNQNG